MRDDDDRCWTQKHLGDETGLGKLIIGKIERGQRVHLDGDTLSRIADALRLTSGERKEFFLAAICPADDHLARNDRNPEEILYELISMMKGMQLPAFIVDSYGDIIRAKKSAAVIFGIAQVPVRVAAEPDGYNIMHLMFAPEYGHVRDVLGRQWNSTALQGVGFFRCITLRYRFTAHFGRTICRLRKYPLFRQFWQQTRLIGEDYRLGGEYLRYQHPEYGMLNYFLVSSTALTTSGELYLLMCVPANDSTTKVFTDLAGRGGEIIWSLAPWPVKALTGYRD